jgi:hypothetical protein
MTPRLGLTVHPHWTRAPWDSARWPDFSPRELACKGTGKLVIHPETLDKLQALRRALGRPVIVTSGYRSPEHNRNIGGARTSWHMDGVAFDVMMTNHDPRAFEMAARAAGFASIGRYPESNFIHIDTRGDFGAKVWDHGPQFPVDAAPFSSPEPQPRPEATPVGRAGVGAAGAGAAVAIAQVAPTIEAVQGLPESVQWALIVAGVALLAAVIIWGPDGLRAALRRLRGGGADL